tara:strand:- start:274 stop:681 length:408 start_codon:yes stop_codon:yes gene_type:complete
VGEDLSNMVQSHGLRIAKLENDVASMSTDLGKIHLTLEHLDEKANDRFTALNTSQVELKSILKARDQEAREYRLSREKFEREQAAARTKWLQGLVSPNTVWIILAIFLSMCSTRALEVQEIVEMTNIKVPNVSTP